MFCPYTGRECSEQCARYDQEKKCCVDMVVSKALASIAQRPSVVTVRTD